MRAAKAEHWWATYCGGEEYKRGADEHGDAILPRYEYETEKQHAARRSATPVYALADDLVTKRVGDVFGQPIARPALGGEGTAGNELFRSWMDDVDGEGSSMDTWMRARFQDALVAGRVFVGVEAPRQVTTEGMTRADVLQLRELRPYLVWADARNVVDWAPDSRRRPTCGPSRWWRSAASRSCGTSSRSTATTASTTSSSVAVTRVM
jgi:hypothetical protein